MGGRIPARRTGAGGDVDLSEEFSGAGGILAGTGPGTYSEVTPASDGRVLTWSGGSVVWAEPTAGGASVTQYATFGDLPGSADAGALAYVVDASGDPLVSSGPAMYVRNAAGDAWGLTTPQLAAIVARLEELEKIDWTEPLIWVANTDSSESFRWATDVEIDDCILEIDGAVPTTSGNFTVQVDIDGTTVTAAIDVTALSIGPNALTLSVTPPLSVPAGDELTFTVSSDAADLAQAGGLRCRVQGTIG